MRLNLLQGVMALFFSQSALLRPRPTAWTMNSVGRSSTHSSGVGRSGRWNFHRLARLLHRYEVQIRSAGRACCSR